MATARITFGSVLGTVNTAAQTVTGALGAIGSSVGMLSSYVERAAEEQRVRQLADAETFVDRLIEEKAMEHTERQVEVQDFRKRSDLHSHEFDTAKARFEALLRPKVVPGIARVV